MRHSFRLTLSCLCALMLGILFTSTQRAVAQAEDDVIINEFAVNTTSGKEYVELLVLKAGGVNLQNWTLSDVDTRAGGVAGDEGDVTLPAASYLSNIRQGTYVVIVLSTPPGSPQVLTEDIRLDDGNNRLVLILGTTPGLTASGTIDIGQDDNLQLYAGTRAAGTLVDQALAGNSPGLIAGAAWGDNDAATTTDNVNGGNSLPNNSVARFVPVANTLGDFADNDTGARFVVDSNAYGTPSYRNAGVVSDSAVTGNIPSGALPEPPREIADFDGDGRTDFSVWRSDEGNWYILQSSNGATRVQFGWGNITLGDIAVPGDYDGDNKTDIAVYRPSEGNWYVIISCCGGGILRVNWGSPGDNPVPGDYDGDGDTEFAVYRPSEGNWYILYFIEDMTTVTQFGGGQDIPVPGDYDNDGRTDLAVYRPAEGNWYIRRSSGGTTVQQWGSGDDLPVPADYDGDRITDLAVWRPDEGNWYIRQSGGGSLVRNWGGVTTQNNLSTFDIVTPGDYDGDDRADIAIYRPNEGNWYVIRSSDNGVTTQFLLGDTPVPYTYTPNYFVPDPPLP